MAEDRQLAAALGATDDAPGAETVADAPTDEAVDRIIDATLEEVALHGPTRARMGEIAQRAGVSSATLYRRFAAKQDLLQAAMIRETSRFIDSMREVAAQQQTAGDTVVECFVFAMDYIHERTIILRLIESAPDLLLPQFTTRAGPLIQAVTGLMFEVNRENVFVDSDKWQRDLAEERIELVVRIFISLLLTPGVTVDVASPDASRDFARRHLVPLIVQAETPMATRPPG
jgi:AcrR family transcriptional regulator